MENPKLGRLAGLVRRLRDPLQLRIFIAVSMLAVWYFLIYSPLGESIDKTIKDRNKTEAHLVVARDIEALRAEFATYKDRLPATAVTNEWVEYFLGGVRKFPVRVQKLEPKGIKKHGPFDVVVLSWELSGKFEDLDAVLAWIEANPRLLRIDALSFELARGPEGLLAMKLTTLGLAG